MVFRVTGPENVAAVFKSKAQRWGSLHPVFSEVAVFAERQSRESFQKQADPVTGLAWAPHSSVTVAVRGPDARILQDNGTLQGATRAVVRSNGIALENPLDYAKIHQFGWPEGRRSPPPPIPQRRYAGLSPEDLEGIVAIVDDYLSE